METGRPKNPPKKKEWGCILCITCQKQFVVDGNTDCPWKLCDTSDIIKKLESKKAEDEKLKTERQLSAL